MSNPPFWESFPNMFPSAISQEAGKRIPWHKDANSRRSSQVFCLSAFGFLIGHELRDRVVAHFLQRCFGCLASTANGESSLSFRNESFSTNAGGERQRTWTFFSRDHTGS